ncbi:DUF2249 domain-containing protein [Pseudoxanthomonas wuyuanensis]
MTVDDCAAQDPAPAPAMSPANGGPMPLLWLDLRHLPPPEPMQRVLDALPDLRPGQWLVAMTPQRPGPLLEILDAWGYAYRVQELTSGHACVSVGRSQDTAAAPADEA